MMEKVIIEVKNVSKKYIEAEEEKYALNDVSINVYDKEFLVILGGSGSGKSTLLNLIAGLDDMYLGNIFVNGADISKFSKGELSCGDTKNALIEKLTELIIGHQKKRAEVNDDIVNLFYAKDKSVYKKIISPYEKDIPSFSYPAMVTTMRNIDIVKQNLTKQLNNLGTHTRTDKNYLDGFEETQNAEREYIYWIGKQLFKKSNDIKNDIDGYLSSGNDESNIMGLWILRNMVKIKEKV
jgi:ABC-type glutathione transport system ATPase component